MVSRRRLVDLAVAHDAGELAVEEAQLAVAKQPVRAGLARLIQGGLDELMTSALLSVSDLREGGAHLELLDQPAHSVDRGLGLGLVTLEAGEGRVALLHKGRSAWLGAKPDLATLLTLQAYVEAFVAVPVLIAVQVTPAQPSSWSPAKCARPRRGSDQLPLADFRGALRRTLSPTPNATTPFARRTRQPSACGRQLPSCQKASCRHLPNLSAGGITLNDERSRILLRRLVVFLFPENLIITSLPSAATALHIDKGRGVNVCTINCMMLDTFAAGSPRCAPPCNRLGASGKPFSSGRTRVAAAW